MGTYTQLTYNQRYHIYAFLKAGFRQTEIAEIIGVHKATISREIRRNRGKKGYRPKLAHQSACGILKESRLHLILEPKYYIQALVAIYEPKANLFSCFWGFLSVTRTGIDPPLADQTFSPSVRPNIRSLYPLSRPCGRAAPR